MKVTLNLLSKSKAINDFFTYFMLYGKSTQFTDKIAFHITTVHERMFESLRIVFTRTELLLFETIKYHTKIRLNHFEPSSSSLMCLDVYSTKQNVFDSYSVHTTTPFGQIYFECVCEEESYYDCLHQVTEMGLVDWFFSTFMFNEQKIKFSVLLRRALFITDTDFDSQIVLLRGLYRLYNLRRGVTDESTIGRMTESGISSLKKEIKDNDLEQELDVVEIDSFKVENEFSNPASRDDDGVFKLDSGDKSLFAEGEKKSLIANKSLLGEEKSLFAGGEKKSLIAEGEKKSLIANKSLLGEEKSLFAGGEKKRLIAEGEKKSLIANKSLLGEEKSLFAGGEKKSLLGEGKSLLVEEKTFFVKGENLLGEGESLFVKGDKTYYNKEEDKTLYNKEEKTPCNNKREAKTSYNNKKEAKTPSIEKTTSKDKKIKFRMGSTFGEKKEKSIFLDEKYYGDESSVVKFNESPDEVIRTNSFYIYYREFFYYCVALYAQNYVKYLIPPRFPGRKIKKRVFRHELPYLDIDEDDLLVVNYGSKENQCTFLVLVKDDGRLVVTFRGTITAADVSMDMKFEYSSFHGGFVHDGVRLLALNFIEKNWTKVEQLMAERRIKNIIFTGHSLGGSIAQMVAVMLVLSGRMGVDDIEVVSFAPLPAFSEHLSSTCKINTISFVYGDDVVPKISCGSLLDAKFVCASAGAYDGDDLPDFVTTVENFLEETRKYEKLYFLGKIVKFRRSGKCGCSSKCDCIDVEVHENKYAEKLIYSLSSLQHHIPHSILKAFDSCVKYFKS